MPLIAPEDPVHPMDAVGLAQTRASAPQTAPAESILRTGVEGSVLMVVSPNAPAETGPQTGAEGLVAVVSLAVSATALAETGLRTAVEGFVMSEMALALEP